MQNYCNPRKRSVKQETLCKQKPLNQVFFAWCGTKRSPRTDAIDSPNRFLWVRVSPGMSTYILALKIHFHIREWILSKSRFFSSCCNRTATRREGNLVTIFHMDYELVWKISKYSFPDKYRVNIMLF